MQTVETLNEGLKRAYTLTIPAREIIARVEAEVKATAPQVRMPGFRPGKVPANLVRKMHGAAIEQDALNKAVQEGVQALLAEQALRPAMQPAVELDEAYASGRDAEVKVSLEVLPDVPAPQIEGLVLERLTIAADDGAVDTQVARIAGQQKSYDDAAEGHPAIEGDLVTIDFAGKVDGEAFEGGTGEGMAVELGSGRLIPGFEDQLEGATLGESRTLELTFPDDYNVDYLKGKPATFDITVTKLQVPKEAAIDEEFAKSLGLESLDQLRGLVRDQVEQEHNGLTRTHMKRKLLDQLAASHDFEVPPSMVEAEFGQIWRQLEHEAGQEADPAAALAEMQNDRGDYQRIAERRVRLGLLLSEIGRQNGIEISQAEMNRLIAQAAQQYRGEDQKRFIQYVQQDAMAAAQLRAPLYEDKVVDWLFERAEISDRAVTREELEAAIEADEDLPTGHVHGPDCDHGHDHAGHDHAAHDHVGHDHSDHGNAGHDHAADGEPAEADEPAETAEVPAGGLTAVDDAAAPQPAAAVEDGTASGA